VIERPTWFGPAGRELFGWYTAPDGGVASAAVLLCPPVGEEEHNAHQTFRELAAALADRGTASLRFDYRGTGDSVGRWSDPDRVDDWIASVADAFAALRTLGPCQLSVVGMRLGATLAATAADRGLIDPDAMVLWDPCSGKSMLREGRARNPNHQPPPPGAVDTPGYLYDAAMVAALAGLDLAKGLDARPRVATLVLVRDDRPEPRGLRASLDGADVDWGDAKGQGELLDVPMTHSVVPHESLTRIAEWVADHARDQPNRRVALPVSSPLHLATAAGPALTERTVRLGPSGLFGITTECADLADRGPLVVLVNVANDRHVGPGRRWVDAARTWAALGFHVLRLDQSGTGDSPAHDGQEFGTLYAREWLEDLPTALASPPCAGRPLAVVALCSGAYSAMEAAFHVPVEQLYSINVILHSTITSKASPLGDDRRRAARPPIAPLLWLDRRHHRLAAGLWSVYRQLAPWHAPMATVGALAKRDTRVVLLLSPPDGRHFTEVLYWSRRTRTLERAHRCEVVVDSDIDHTLMTQVGQRTVLDWITADLVARYPRDDVESRTASTPSAPSSSVSPGRSPDASPTTDRVTSPH
jgi:alpha-beta hydrolase superfamily lysophospholipase